jgi:hypothetical protein
MSAHPTRPPANQGPAVELRVVDPGGQHLTFSWQVRDRHGHLLASGQVADAPNTPAACRLALPRLHRRRPGRHHRTPSPGGPPASARHGRPRPSRRRPHQACPHLRLLRRRPGHLALPDPRRPAPHGPARRHADHHPRRGLARLPRLPPTGTGRQVGHPQRQGAAAPRPGRRAVGQLPGRPRRHPRPPQPAGPRGPGRGCQPMRALSLARAPPATSPPDRPTATTNPDTRRRTA